MGWEKLVEWRSWAGLLPHTWSGSCMLAAAAKPTELQVTHDTHHTPESSYLSACECWVPHAAAGQCVLMLLLLLSQHRCNLAMNQMWCYSPREWERVCVSVSFSLCGCGCVSVHVCMHAYMCVCEMCVTVHVCTHACVCVCMYVFVRERLMIDVTSVNVLLWVFTIMSFSTEKSISINLIWWSTHV